MAHYHLIITHYRSLRKIICNTNYQIIPTTWDNCPVTAVNYGLWYCISTAGYHCCAVLGRRRRRWGLHIVTPPHLRLITFRDTTPRCFVLLILHIDAPPTAHRYLFWRSWAVASWEHWSGMLGAMRAFILRDSVFGARDGGLHAVRIRGGPAQGFFCRLVTLSLERSRLRGRTVYVSD
jgi:hypothetical protein